MGELADRQGTMSTPTQFAIYALTRQGLTLALKLADSLGGTVYALSRHAAGTDALAFESLTSLVAENFDQYDGHVFVAAAGIVVRCIAPHVTAKTSDPAVVCLDQQGRYAVSLLSGHLGGGNALAERCAAIVDGQAVITTATDSAGVPSLDMLAAEKGLTIGNIDRVKVVNGALLDGRPIQIYDLENRLGLAGDARFRLVTIGADWVIGAPGVWVSIHDDCPDADALWLYPRILVLGVGCRRGVPADEIFTHIRNVFDDHGLSLLAIHGVASAEAKRDEGGLLEVAAALGVEPVFYEPDELGAVEVPNPSGMVQGKMGTSSVSEAAALLLSKGVLLVEKTKTKTVTLAVARR